MTAISQFMRLLKKNLLDLSQAAPSYLVFGLVRLMPIGLASALGGWLGRAIGPHLSRTKVARRNLAHAFPEKSEGEIEGIILGMWENIGRTAFEFPHLNRMKIYDEGSRVQVLGAENIDRLRDDGKPGIFFAGHLANWEVPALSVDRRGLPIHLIYRAPNNRLAEFLFRRRRPGKGELIPKGPQGARRALKLLAKGEHLGVLVDQKMNDGIPVPFFGRAAMTATALAQMAIKFDCPVVPVRAERLNGAKFRITHFKPLEMPNTGNRQADIAAIMTTVNALLEQWVRERPEQWLWVHNRWAG